MKKIKDWEFPWRRYLSFVAEVWLVGFFTLLLDTCILGIKDLLTPLEFTLSFWIPFSFPPALFYLFKFLMRPKYWFRRVQLEKKYGPRYTEAVKQARYRAPALDVEMTPASLRVADEARLIKSDPGEVDELISLQPTPSISKTAVGQ
ncbi:MAG: hypothetical protein WCT54_03535 [Patescibacteria group bacterium]|jgi:hypothetical protein